MNALKQGLIALTLGLTGVAHAADQPANTVSASPSVAEAPREPLLELEEVLVHGKRLQQRIIEAEDEFYKLFNEINTDDDYDTNCAQVPLGADSGSRIDSRLCLPVFVANAVADYTVWRRACQPPMDGFDEFSCLDRNRDERLTRQEAAVRPSLDAQFFSLDADTNGYLSRDELPEEGMSAPPTYMPPPPELVLAEGTKRWYDHTLKVINSNERLREMAGKLDEMHMEFNGMRRQVAELEAEREANAEPVKRGKPRPPR